MSNLCVWWSEDRERVERVLRAMGFRGAQTKYADFHVFLGEYLLDYNRERGALAVEYHSSGWWLCDEHGVRECELGDVRTPEEIGLGSKTTYSDFCDATGDICPSDYEYYRGWDLCNPWSEYRLLREALDACDARQK